jgi:hypothetical protein
MDLKQLVLLAFQVSIPYLAWQRKQVAAAGAG